MGADGRLASVTAQVAETFWCPLGFTSVTGVTELDFSATFVLLVLLKHFQLNYLTSNMAQTFCSSFGESNSSLLLVSSLIN